MSESAPLAEPVLLPKGFGFRALSGYELRERGGGLEALMDLCLIWEPPRKRGRHRYVLGVDVADGMGGDRSCIQVLRVQTLDEPAEQVAEYLSDSVEPAAMAYVVQALGEYYRDADGVEAKAAIEYTHHGLSTIDTLHLHLQYQNLYRWEFLDAADPNARFASVFGWHTTPRSRPVLVDKLRAALITIDPVTGLPDLITHSPRLHDELQDFQTQGALWEAAAAKGAHDDTVMALAIANIVAWRMQAGESEPLEDRRRRKSEQQAALAAAQQQVAKVDYRNTPTSTEELERYGVGVRDPRDRWDDDEMDTGVYDPRMYEETLF